MEGCLRCGETDVTLFEVVKDGNPDEVVGRICVDCEDDLVWNGIEVGAAGTCGYSENCNRVVSYVTFGTNSSTGSSGEALVRSQKRNNILCEQHLQQLRTE